MNNDKALAALTEDEIKASFVEFINWVKPNTGLSPSTVGTIQKVFKEALNRQALTPQSSAGLGRVREALNELGNHNHFDHTMQSGAGCKTCIRQRALRNEALAILDQQAAPETVIHACVRDQKGLRFNIRADLKHKIEKMRKSPSGVINDRNASTIGVPIYEPAIEAYNAACDQFLRILDEVIGRAE